MAFAYNLFRYKIERRRIFEHCCSLGETRTAAYLFYCTVSEWCHIIISTTKGYLLRVLLRQTVPINCFQYSLKFTNSLIYSASGESILKKVCCVDFYAHKMMMTDTSTIAHWRLYSFLGRHRTRWNIHRIDQLIILPFRNGPRYIHKKIQDPLLIYVIMVVLIYLWRRYAIYWNENRIARFSI